VVWKVLACLLLRLKHAILKKRLEDRDDVLIYASLVDAFESDKWFKRILRIAFFFRTFLPVKSSRYVKNTYRRSAGARASI
jgi:hypothetical protein